MLSSFIDHGRMGVQGEDTNHSVVPKLYLQEIEITRNSQQLMSFLAYAYLKQVCHRLLHKQRVVKQTRILLRFFSLYVLSTGVNRVNS